MSERFDAEVESAGLTLSPIPYYVLWDIERDPTCESALKAVLHSEPIEDATCVARLGAISNADWVLFGTVHEKAGGFAAAHLVETGNPSSYRYVRFSLPAADLNAAVHDAWEQLARSENTASPLP